MVKNIMQITVVDNSKGEKCDAHCGLDWSSPEAMDFASQRIKDKFGNKVQLEYIDLAKPNTHRRILELEQQVKAKNLTLPLLMINSQPRISGQFDIRMLLDVIEAELEIEV